MPPRSVKPLSGKLGIRADDRVLLLGPPAGIADRLAPLPDGVRLLGRAGKPVDIVICFARRLCDLQARLPSAIRLVKTDGGIWIAWPKKASGAYTDLQFESVQRIGLEAGLVDNKTCAIDNTWSGLRFVYRLRDR